MASGPAAVVYKHFEKLTDPRINRGKNHDLIELIFLALTATICGAQSWVDVERFAKSKRDWFRRFIRLKQGVPSHDTFGRVFAVLDTGEFLSAMHAWVDAFAGSLRGRPSGTGRLFFPAECRDIQLRRLSPRSATAAARLLITGRPTIDGSIRAPEPQHMVAEHFPNYVVGMSSPDEADNEKRPIVHAGFSAPYHNRYHDAECLS